jgi:hypothetical protein
MKGLNGGRGILYFLINVELHNLEEKLEDFTAKGLDFDGCKLGGLHEKQRSSNLELGSHLNV